MHRLDPQVSVIIPAHNEAPTIAAVVGRVRAAQPDAEILVVDDGSTDGTAELAQQTEARLLRLERNGGKGRAIREGVRAAAGEILVFIDADGQDDPAEIPAMLAALGPDVDLVLGSRFVGRFNDGAITRFNRLGTQGINAISRLLFRSGITDPCAGFRAVRRSALEAVQIKADGYDIEVDVVFRILRAGGRVVEVPAVRSARANGRSGLNSLRDGLCILRQMVSIRLERRPRTLAGRGAGRAQVLDPERGRPTAGIR
jgi:glycosyltransferase involved in cell wall biosynthesis